MDVRDRLAGFVRGLPVAHRVGIVAAVVTIALAFVVFMSWVTTPSYTVLYSGLAEGEVASTINELESLGVPYQIEGGGSRILVPRDRLYATRASLAQAGIAGQTEPKGYELLDDQGLAVSDFRQKVDYRRALEGEMERTLAAMSGIASAEVHLVMPEDELFQDQQEPTTASVLLSTTRPLEQTEVEAVAFLVASSVEGLETNRITIADAKGTVLHAPGDAGGSGLASRQLRQTREFEQSLAADTAALLERATGSPASVVVRAQLNFDESQVETEVFNPDSQIALREQESIETFEGTGAVPGGTVGVDGGPLPGAEGEEKNFNREDRTREFGVDRTRTTTIQAPGKIERLSVAIVMDDGTQTGVAVPADGDVEALVSAAIGLDADRGDSVAVSKVAFPAVDEEAADEAAAEEQASLMGLLQQAVGAAVLLLVALALFLSSRRKGKGAKELAATPVSPIPSAPVAAVEEPKKDEALQAKLLDALPGHIEESPVNTALRSEVADLVQAQPEQIATLLRGWLADRRAV